MAISEPSVVFELDPPPSRSTTLSPSPFHGKLPNAAAPGRCILAVHSKRSLIPNVPLQGDSIPSVRLSCLGNPRSSIQPERPKESTLHGHIVMYPMARHST